MFIQQIKIDLAYLRSTMGQDRLSGLTCLNVEREKLEMINFDDIIDKFAWSKARKINAQQLVLLM